VGPAGAVELLDVPELPLEVPLLPELPLVSDVLVLGGDELEAAAGV
jgi:hypothetical protein